MTRRAFGAGLCLCCLPALARENAFALEEVGPSVFMRRGIDAEVDAANLDGIANIGFIIGEKSVLVTESGGSLADGRLLRKMIRDKTDKPIQYVVLSHVHPDHVFGAGAFVEDKPVFIGHHNLPEALGMRGAFYRKRLVDILGESNAGPVVAPTRTIKGREEIDLGGRRIVFTAHEPAHTTSDLSMLDISSGLFLPADLLFVGRMPSLDGSLTGWIAQLEAMRKQNYGGAVPGHGPVSVEFGPASAALLRYLTAVRDGVRAEIDGGGSIERAMSHVAQSERDHWKLFDDYNKRNVAEAFSELEWQ
ncbi:quinoprotein relay system zinc metallohydrolase 2 [Rhodoblastus acidophilus]|nr:quinoprotein relay system zinc metallohydrolase 2 [Rhodoblastus acidophilus]